MRTPIVVGMTALLLALPVAAQQTTPSTQAPSGTPAAGGPGAGPTGGPGSQGMMSGRVSGGMGMMDPSGRRDVDEDDDDDEDSRAGRMRGWRHGRGGRETPMRVIINIGPDNRVEVEERGGRGVGTGPRGWHSMMGGQWHGRSMTDRMEARLDYLRGELRLTPEQQPAWDRFASAVRDAAGHMRPSLEVMAQGQQPLEQRLTAREATLAARLEAIRAIRAALSGLTGALNEAQRRALDEHADVLMPGMRPMGTGAWR